MAEPPSPLHARSQQILQEARNAMGSHNSENWRQAMHDKFISKHWSGKTMPFMMPLMMDSSSKALIISPLKVLQEEQAARFRRMGITAAAVNKDTWNPQLKKDIENGKFQALLTSPEMCLRNEDFRRLLIMPTFTSSLKMVVINETHCISQWGGDFRTDYGNLSKLRSFFPPSTPFLATSATLPPTALRDIRAIFTILPLLTHDGSLPKHTDDLIKTCLFVNKIPLALELHRYSQSQVADSLKPSIDMLHSLRSTSTKRRVMKDFTRGATKVLVATEAAGMGADIPDIEQVIQFGIPSSLSVWIQWAGCAGRTFNIEARAILLAEISMFKQQKASMKTKYDHKGNEDLDDGREWVKKVELELRRWIETKECRRDILDLYFDNPPGRQAASHICCDNCEGAAAELPCDNCDEVAEDFQEESRPVTPTSQAPSASTSTHSTPSCRANANGKRPMKSSIWRFDTKREHYSPSSFTAAAILPDSVLTTLASHLTIKTFEDYELQSLTPWILAPRHFGEVMAVLQQVDVNCESQKLARLEEVESTRIAKQQKKEDLRIERQQAKLQVKHAKDLKDQLEKEAKKQEEKERREVAAQAKIAKIVAASCERAELRTPMALRQYTSIFNTTPTPATPLTISNGDVLQPVQIIFDMQYITDKLLVFTYVFSFWRVFFTIALVTIISFRTGTTSSSSLSLSLAYNS
ncbi:P-loop containing nucleoside triphosphate hydrolase protein [Cyathus striatus]|nr:P-loop containing nucleoside triphosphate hydrolase protein [Cyathus striatus]